MRKIFTLLAATLCSITSFAQDIQLETKDGQVIENGSTVVIKGEMVDMMIYGQFESNLYVRNLTESNQGVYAELKAITGDSQICWGGSCVPVTAGSSYTTKMGLLNATSSSSLLIESLIMTAGYMDAVVTRSIEITIWTDKKPEDKIMAKVVYTNNPESLNYRTISYMIDGVLCKTQSLPAGEDIVPLSPPAKEGYTFNGWNNLPGIMPDEDIVVNGSYTVNSYELTYILDGNVFHKKTYPYGTIIESPNVPQKEGYTFGGWNNIPETMPAGDVTVEGIFIVNNYVVKYIVDGVEYAVDYIPYNSNIVLREEPVREGYTFSGWSEAPGIMPANDVTVTGTFTANTYQLIYVLDGVTFKTETLVFGSVVNALEVPNKEGYTFSGWANLPAIMPAKNTTVNGKYNKNSYTITYMVDGVVYNTQSMLFESNIALLDDPEMEGYTFNGWNCDWETMPPYDITINGYFTINSYSLTYMLDGEIYKQETKLYGTQIKTVEAPIKDGYTFSGWGDVPAVMPAVDLTLEGHYVVNKHTLNYYVDGNLYTSIEMEYGTELTALMELTKIGHTFSGWSEIPETMPDNNVRVDGFFTINKYAVTYMIDGEIYSTDSISYGENVMLLSEPIREGYTFSGWSEVPETMPAKDVTVVGQFTVNTYQLTYILDGEVYATMLIQYGSPLYLITAPTKEGFIFSGWSEIPEMMPAHDVEVTGEFASGMTFITTRTHVDVYTLQGVMVKQQVPVEELESELPRGIYIIEGRKVALR